MAAKIFLSVVSFQDNMIHFTIASAMNSSIKPDRLHFCIIDQGIEDKSKSFFSSSSRITYVHINPVHSMGVCWARALAMNAYDGEEYFLQIDSHTAFSDGWDETLIEKYNKIASKVQNKNFVISTRPHSFTISPEKQIITNIFSHNTINLKPKNNKITVQDPVILYDAIPANDRRAYRGAQVSAAFIFARGDLVESFPYDPYMYFHGEEQSYAFRLFSGGWDIWHVCDVPLFHMYKARKGDEPKLHWDAEFDSQRNKSFEYYRLRANMRLYNLYNGNCIGSYCAQGRRSLAEFMELSGLKIE